MSKRGNDLVRRYLWMAALSAVRCNPAVRALYARVVAKHPQHKAIAIGHAMRKLLHLVFAVWKSDKPFDPATIPGRRRPTSRTSDNRMSARRSGASDKRHVSERPGRGPQAGPSRRRKWSPRPVPTA